MGIDCSLILKNENNKMFEIHLDRFYVFNKLNYIETFVAKEILINELTKSAGLSDKQGESNYVSYWKGYAIGCLENLMDDWKVINEVGIFNENHPVMQRLQDKRQDLGLKYSDKVWIEI